MLKVNLKIQKLKMKIIGVEIDMAIRLVGKKLMIQQ